MKKEIIGIVGGPGTGKTTLINALTRQGFCCYPEISRQITLEAQKQGIEQLFLQDPLQFSELLLEGRINQYKNALKETCDFIFIDRGIPDIIAYLHSCNTPIPDHFVQACRNYVYTKIFILPPWKEIYETDEARYETFAESERLYNHILTTYKHFGYTLIEVPHSPLSNRISFVLNSILQP